MYAHAHAHPQPSQQQPQPHPFDLYDYAAFDALQSRYTLDTDAAASTGLAQSLPAGSMHPSVLPLVDPTVMSQSGPPPVPTRPPPLTLSFDWIEQARSPMRDGNSIPGPATARAASPLALVSARSSAEPTRPFTAPASSTSFSLPASKEALTNVVVACRQCRGRKIRCDSSRPSCQNCVRRNNVCEYDAAPKRRGPDKVPGMRKRVSRPARTSSSPTSGTSNTKDGQEASQPPRKRRRTDATVASCTSEASDNTRSPVTSRVSTPTPMPTTISAPSLVPVTTMPGGMGMAAKPLPRRSLNRVRAPPPITLPALPAHSVTIVQPAVEPGYAPNYPPTDLKSAPEFDTYGHIETLESVAVPSQAISQMKVPSLPAEAMQALQDPLGRDWWQDLIAQYSPTPDQSVKDIEQDLVFVFTTPSTTLSIVHVPLLIQTLRSPEERMRLQPALIFAALALSTLMRSSTVELSTAGSTRAVWLRDAAGAHFESALRSGRADYGLAQAALLLAMFEASAHPRASAARSVSALTALDRVLTAARMLAADAHDGASMFARYAPPVVLPPPPPPSGVISIPSVMRIAASPAPSAFDGGSPFGGLQSYPNMAPSVSSSFGSPTSSTGLRSPATRVAPNCTCSRPVSVGKDAWEGWDAAEWTAPQIRREEARRTVWAALGLAASHAVRCVVFDVDVHPLSLFEPGNYALLFPNEFLDRSNPVAPGGLSAKDGVWALHTRATLLWASCALHLHLPSSGPNVGQPAAGSVLNTDDARAEFAIEAWTEAQSIEDALSRHACGPDSEMMYTAREYVFNARKLVAQVFRRMQDVDPKALVSRRQAEEWLFYQDQIVQRVNSLVNLVGEPPAHVFSRRPWQATWFATQVAICLQLWTQEPSLRNALELGKKFLVPCDVLDALWPSQYHQSRTDELRRRLDRACVLAGIMPAPPAASVLPPALRPTPTGMSAADLFTFTA